MSEVLAGNEAIQVKQKVTKESFNLVTVYNPLLNNLQNVKKYNLPLFYSDLDMRAVFPEGSIMSCTEEGKTLKTKSQSMISKCGEKCDICDNFLICRNKFTCKFTGKT